MTNEIQQPYVSKTWESFSRPASPSPLVRILGTHVEPDRFTGPQLDRLRRHVATSVPLLPTPDLDRFLGELFSAPEVVSAYFRPTLIHDRADPELPTRNVLPFDVAMAAAKKAAASPSLLPHERGLAWLAAYTYPCGIFAAADPSLRPLPEVDLITQQSDVKALRSMLIRDALRRMRNRNQPLGDTLAAVMDLGIDEQCDPQQIARILTAVRLAVVGIEQMWRGWE